MLCSYLQSLFALAHDASFAVRREVCVGLVQLLSVQPDKLQPFLYQVSSPEQTNIFSHHPDTRTLHLRTSANRAASCQLQPFLLQACELLPPWAVALCVPSVCPVGVRSAHRCM